MRELVTRLGDRLLERLVPKTQAAAATAQFCIQIRCLTALCPDGRIVDCYKTCCDNPPICTPCYCPCAS